MTALPDYVTPEYLEHLNLRKGCGSGKEGDRCAIQEYRAWVGLDASKDECPPDMCPVVHKLIISLQDYRPEWRKAIALVLPKFADSKRELAVTVKRAFACADFAVRVCAVNALISAGLNEEAEKMKALAPIVDQATSDAASYASRAASYAASYAASDASYASRAASDASRAASRAASYAATRAASYAPRAASDASRAASYASRAASDAASYAPRAASDAIDPVAFLLSLLDIQ